VDVLNTLQEFFVGCHDAKTEQGFFNAPICLLQ